MKLDRTSTDPVGVWDMYFCGLVSMTIHPGFNQPGTPTFTLTELAKIADQMIEERQK